MIARVKRWAHCLRHTVTLLRHMTPHHAVDVKIDGKTHVGCECGRFWS